MDFILDNDLQNINNSTVRKDCDEHMLPQSSYKVELKMGKGQTKQFNWTSNDCGDEIDILNQFVSLIREQTVAVIPAGELQPTDITAE